ncbi:MAG: hypothetical protein H0W73_16280 [Bacteroidetes bacterium]|nr:hypothetical protein [Bacteroidota bacterium]
MKVHTTNYQNTFIEMAEDCPVEEGQIPPLKGENKSIANLQFDMIIKHPYKYTSDDVLFTVYAERNNIPKSQLKELREQFFSKGQPCLRTSPLTKRYGWGVHSDEKSKIALYAAGTKEYTKFLKDKTLKVVKAMRTSK